jgi:type IV secretory pathway protease TraF
MSGGASRYLLAGGVSCLLLAFGGLVQPTKRLVLNTTASAPLGFYWLAGQEPDVGDLALVRPPPPLARWMAMRGYLPMNVPLIKRVAAVTGQLVCGDHGRVLIDGQAVAKVLLHDRLHRPLKGIGEWGRGRSFSSTATRLIASTVDISVRCRAKPWWDGFIRSGHGGR